MNNQYILWKRQLEIVRFEYHGELNNLRNAENLIKSEFNNLTNNLTALRIEVQLAIEKATVYVDRSRKMIDTIYQQVQQDATLIVDKSRKEIEQFTANRIEDWGKFRDGLIKDLVSVKDLAMGELNALIDVLTEFKLRIENAIGQLKRYAREVLSFIADLTSPIKAIVDAIDYLIPGDITIPVFPVFPVIDFPTLSDLKEIMDEVLTSLGSLKDNLKDRISEKIIALKVIAESAIEEFNGIIISIASEIEKKVNGHRVELMDIIINFPYPENLLKKTYWTDNFKQPLNRVYLQTGVMVAKIESATTSIKDKSSVSGNKLDLIDKTNRYIVYSIYAIILLLAIIWFIGYIFRFRKNLTVAYYLLRGEEPVDNNLYNCYI